MGHCWSWSSRSSSCQRGITQVKTVTIINGQEFVTYDENPSQAISYGQPEGVHQFISYGHPNAMASSMPQISTEKPQTPCQFEKECLDEHNRLRAIHGCPPLKLSKTLNAYATEWARHLSSRNTLEHRREGKYGENIFMAGGSNVTGRMVVKMWYDEVAKYNYSQPGFRNGIGHFTQVVWKNSKEVGFGVAKSGSATYVVANYDPPGNYANQFQENVPRPIM